MGIVAKFADSFVNLLSGIGTPRDKGAQSTYFFVPISQQELVASYRTDWIARKVIDCPAQDATREWRQWMADTNDVELIEKEERRLDIQRKLRTALAFARLFGGSALVLGIKDQDPSQELDIDSVKQGDLQFVHVCSRWAIHAGPPVMDIMSPYFREPEYYSRNSVAISDPLFLRIHPSRVIVFQGAPIPDDNVKDCWGDSILQIVMDAVKDAGLVTSSIATLVTESKIDVIKIPDLTEQLSSPESTRKLATRFTTANSLKSIINTIILDKEEEWNRITANFTSLPDILKVYLLIASGAADIPATRMLGQSAVGFNATGDSDVRNYYDRISSDQENELTPILTRLDEVLIRAALGSRDESIYYDWRPLWQLSEPEKIAMAKQKAEIYKIDMEGLMDVEALRIGRQNQLIEDGIYPGLEAALEKQKVLEMSTMLSPEEQEAQAQEMMAALAPPGSEPGAEGGPAPPQGAPGSAPPTGGAPNPFAKKPPATQ